MSSAQQSNVLPSSESNNDIGQFGVPSGGLLSTSPTMTPIVENEQSKIILPIPESVIHINVPSNPSNLVENINMAAFVQKESNSYHSSRRNSIDEQKAFEGILSSVVKIYCTSTTPHYSMPWQMKRQSQSTSSGFIIKDKFILGNAHGVTHATSVRIRKHGDSYKFVARILYTAHECDLVVLTVDDESFWEGLVPLEFGGVPRLQDSVLVIGYPTGGDNLSITKGIVSRVIVSTYSHSGENLLTIQIDAAINSGNSGGPAMQNNKVVGVAFESLVQAQSIGYIIPVPVIEHVLLEIATKNSYIGFPHLCINWQKMENDSLRNFYKIQKGQKGILVHSIEALDPLNSLLKPGDVITKVDGVQIADDGTIYFRYGERVSFRYIETQKYIGGKMSVDFIRDGKECSVETTLQARSSLVPLHLHDQLPQYLIYGGFVFTVLSRAYLYHEWGKEWHKKAPVDLVSLAYYAEKKFSEEQVLILSQILVDDINNGYSSSLHNTVLTSLNGITIKNIQHLNQILDDEASKSTPFRNFCIDRDKIVILQHDMVAQAEQRILESNSIAFAKSIDLRTPRNKTESKVPTSSSGTPPFLEMKEAVSPLVDPQESALSPINSVH